MEHIVIIEASKEMISASKFLIRAKKIKKKTSFIQIAKVQFTWDIMEEK